MPSTIAVFPSTTKVSQFFSKPEFSQSPNICTNRSQARGWQLPLQCSFCFSLWFPMSQQEGIRNNEIEVFRQAVPPPTTPKNNSSRQMIQGNFQSNLPLLSAWGHYLRKQAIGKKKCLSKLNQKQTPGYEEENQSGTPQPPPAAPPVTAKLKLRHSDVFMGNELHDAKKNV